MAEQLGIIQYRGKLGNTVGAKKSGTQRNNVMRVKVDPSNPRTRAQAAQRMKMNTALKMYRAIEPILSRSWQNKKYGTESRQFFMSQLMKSSFNGWLCPAAKGDYIAYPSQCAISIGSIPVNTAIQCNQRTVEGALLEDFDLTAWHFDAATKNSFGAMCQNLIDNVAGLENGDQITVVAAYQVDESDPDSQVVWYYDSLVIDTTSTETVDIDQEVLLETANGTFKFVKDNDEGLYWFSNYDAPTGSVAIAYGVIVSREKNAQAGQAGLRTSSNLCVSTAFMGGKASRYEEFLRTYMSGDASGNSDWPVDAETGGGGSAAVEDIVTETSVTVGGTTYANVAYVKHQGTKYVPYRDVTGQDQTVLEYTYRRENDTTFKAQGGTSIGAMPDDAAWLAAGYTLVTKSRFNQLVPGFTFIE